MITDHPIVQWQFQFKPLTRQTSHLFSCYKHINNIFNHHKHVDYINTVMFFVFENSLAKQNAIDKPPTPPSPSSVTSPSNDIASNTVQQQFLKYLASSNNNNTTPLTSFHQVGENKNINHNQHYRQDDVDKAAINTGGNRSGTIATTTTNTTESVHVVLSPFDDLTLFEDFTLNASSKPQQLSTGINHVSKRAK